MSTSPSEEECATPRAALSAQAPSASRRQPCGRSGAARPRTCSGAGSTSSLPGAPRPRAPGPRRARGRGTAASSPRTVHKDRTHTRYSLHDLFRQLALQDTPRTVESAHHGADRDVEDLGSVRVAELADVDEHQHVAEVVRHVRERVDDRTLRKLLDRRRLRRALLAPAAVDIEVREDAEQPGAQVRAGSERAPAPKCPRIRLLHQVLGLLAGADQVPRNPENLVGQLQRLFFETNAITRLLGDAPGLCLGRLAHRATLPTRLLSLERG